MRYTSVGEASFIVERGDLMVLDAEPRVDPMSLQLIILQQGIAAVLHRRGWLVCHASSVLIAGRVVVFAGESGGGKSTIAMGLSRRGHVFLGDELTPIREGQGGSAESLAGFSNARIDEKGAARFGLTPQDVIASSPMLSKAMYRVPGSQPQHPLTVARLYILQPSETAGVENVTGSRRLLEFARHTYWLSGLVGDQRARHLKACAEVVKAIDVRILHRPRDLESIDGLMDIIEADVEGRLA